MSKESGRKPIELTSRLSEPLLPSAKLFYNQVLTKPQQLRYERALHEVSRMGVLREKGLVPDSYGESNLEHTIAACDKVREWATKYPSLDKYASRAQMGLLVHDSGEVHPKIGDVQPVDRTPEEERRKRLEPFAARAMMRFQIPDENARRLFREIYDWYQANDPNDVSVQLARFADKAQGTMDHAGVVFNVHTHPDKRSVIEGHLVRTLSGLYVPAINLLTALNNRREREQARDLILHEFDPLIKYGPRGVVESFRKGFAA